MYLSSEADEFNSYYSYMYVAAALKTWTHL